MKQLKLLLPIIAMAMLMTSCATTGSGKYTCNLTGKTHDECCCEKKDGKFLCKDTGKVLDTCCCIVKH